MPATLYVQVFSHGYVGAFPLLGVLKTKKKRKDILLSRLSVSCAPLPSRRWIVFLVDVSPRPPLHQQQQQQQQDTTLSLAPTPPSGATGALAATADLASGDHNPRLPAASSKVETRSTGNSADNEARPQQHQQQPCGNSDSKSERTAAVDGGGVTELSEKGPASATTTAPTASVPAEATARTGSTTQSGQGGREKNGRGQGPRGAGVIAPDAETVAARHAAVATAVEARSKMTRFAGGLEGGAGADGGSAGANFECEEVVGLSVFGLFCVGVRAVIYQYLYCCRVF